jgi:hypothetical protein
LNALFIVDQGIRQCRSKRTTGGEANVVEAKRASSITTTRSPHPGGAIGQAPATQNNHGPVKTRSPAIQRTNRSDRKFTLRFRFISG